MAWERLDVFNLFIRGITLCSLNSVITLTHHINRHKPCDVASHVSSHTLVDSGVRHFGRWNLQGVRVLDVTLIIDEKLFAVFLPDDGRRGNAIDDARERDVRIEENFKFIWADGHVVGWDCRLVKNQRKRSPSQFLPKY